MENDITKMFNLPLYTRNKSFAQASKNIQNRFKDRTDKESLDTQKDLLERLKSAQEYVKAQEQTKQKAKADKAAMAQGDAIVDDTGQVINRNDPAVQNGSVQPNQPPQPPQVPQEMQTQMQAEQQAPDMQQPQSQESLMGQIQNCMGGKMIKKYDLGGFTDYVQGDANLNGKVDEADKIDKFGNPLQSTTTSSMPDVGGALGAATTAMSLGNKAFGSTGIDTSGATATGKTNVTMGALSGAAEGAQAGSKFGPYGAMIGGTIGAGAGLMGAIAGNKDAQTSQVNNTYMKASQNNNQFAYAGYVDRKKPKPAVVKDTTPQQEILSKMTPTTSSSLSSGLDPSVNGMTNRAQVNIAGIEKKLMPTYTGMPTTASSTGSENKFKLTDPLEALRYAPAAMNAYQLAKLKKPSPEGTDRLTNRYQPQYADENAIMNSIREETNAQREAIRQTSGGSASEARANLLATQLSSMKGLSAASAAGREQNAAEKRQAQSFNLGVDQANLSQSNLQQDINDKNLGQYDTMRSQLLASVGDTAGAIGKEELYKKYPEMMGLSYDWRGKYDTPAEAEQARIKAARAKDLIASKGKYSKTGSLLT